jgi:hypothetical protein
MIVKKHVMRTYGRDLTTASRHFNFDSALILTNSNNKREAGKILSVCMAHSALLHFVVANKFPHL